MKFLNNIIYFWMERVWKHPQMARLQAASTRPVALALAALAVLGLYLFRIGLHPGYHGDEFSLISIPWRFAEFHDFRYTVNFTESYNSGEMRFYPPLMAFMFRVLVHAVAGFSAMGDRIVSAFFIYSLVMLFALLVWRASGRKWAWGLLAVLVMGLHPALVTAARTVRFEQEILFMGVFSVLSVLLWAEKGKDFRTALVWFLSGVTAGWAAASHPWGCVFPLVLGASQVFFHKAWREKDGLHFLQRAFVWSVGGAFPLMVALIQVTQRWPEFLSYTQSLREFYDVRDGQMISYFLRRYNIPLDAETTGARFLANLVQLHMYGYGASASKYGGITFFPLGFIYQGIFWALIVSILASVRSVWRARLQTENLPRAVMVMLAIAFMIFQFFYIPNQVYYLYSAFCVPAAALLLLASRDEKPAWLVACFSWLAALGVVFFVSYSAYLALTVSSVKVVSLDRQFEALGEMSDRLALEEKEGHAYCDSATWRACGKDGRSYLDLFREDRARKISAIVTLPETFNAYVKRFAEMWDRYREGKRSWLAEWTEFRGQAALAGVIAVLPDERGAGFHFYVSGAPSDHLYVTVFEKDGRKTKWNAEVLSTEKDGSGHTSHEGRYLIIAPAGSALDLDMGRVLYESVESKLLDNVVILQLRKDETYKAPRGVLVYRLIEGT